MSTVRRVYLYIVAAAGLVTLAVGAANLGQALVLATTSGGERLVMAGLRSQVALGAAAAVVGLPVWLLHWLPASRAAERDPAERAALLRRLYLYVALAAAAFLGWLYTTATLERLFRLTVAGASNPTQVLLPVPAVAVTAVVWWYHRRVAALDRAAVGEVGAAATLRRWERYGIAFITLAGLLDGTALLVRFTWETMVAGGGNSPVSGGAAAAASAAALALVSLAVWLGHWLGWAVAPPAQQPKMAAQDAASTLRPVYLFLALALSVVMTLVGAWQAMFYALGRLLGVPSPGGAGGSLLLAAAGPVSLMLVYGVCWLYQRQALALQTRAQSELPEQAGVRRLYVYLVCLVALAVLAAGVGGLLWTLSDLATNAPHAGEMALWWRDRISLFTALTLVGLPVWLLHWQPVADASRVQGEAASLTRRLYVYLTLLAGVLALLGAGVVAVKQVFDLLLGATASAIVATNLARSLSVAAVAGVIVFYHQRVLRADVRYGRVAAGPEPEAPRALEAATPSLAAASVAAESVRFADGALSVSGRPFGVICHTANGADGITWHTTAAEARAAYQRLRGWATPAEWVVLVHVEEASGLASQPDATSAPSSVGAAA
jgi:hypothetical protein